MIGAVGFVFLGFIALLLLTFMVHIPHGHEAAHWWCPYCWIDLQ